MGRLSLSPLFIRNIQGHKSVTHEKYQEDTQLKYKYKTVRRDSYSSRRPRFNPRVGHAEFVVHELALGSSSPSISLFPTNYHSTLTYPEGQYNTPEAPALREASLTTLTTKASCIRVNCLVSNQTV